MTNKQIIKGLTKMLEDTIEANQCGLSNKDFKNDIELLQSALSLIKEQEKYIKDANDITEEMNGDIMRLIYELKQKDKQIDYIIDFIRERSIYAVDTHEQLKQYFADLVEKE